MLRVYNSLSRRKEIFRPADGKRVKFYTCGPTVYSRPHIGNYRTYVAEDTVKRLLLCHGYRVRHAMNITDLDNTIIKEVVKTGVGRKKLTAKYEKLFREDIASLSILPAGIYPHVSKYACKMARFADSLVKMGKAYRIDGKTYFDLTSYPSYGKLAGKRIADRNRPLMREEYKPFQSGDFLLMEPCSHPCHGCGELSHWKGKPAWNIQCAVMSTATLGAHIDLAMGGRDNLFNHHENTRAIAEARHGGTYAKYWMHVRHLIINGKKMSKSKGNVVRLPDLLKKGITPSEVRMLLLSVHYRKRLDYTDRRMSEIRKRFAALKDGIGAIREANGLGAPGFERLAAGAKKEFEAAMDDDVDAPKAIGAVEKYVLACGRTELSKKQSREAMMHLSKFNSVLAFLPV
ncbi:MAG: class I tRNA ligase family protein [Candidatus Micrarchaeia archaeon]